METDTCSPWHIRKAVPEDEKRIREIAQSSYAIYLDRMALKPFPMLDDYAVHIDNGTIYVLEARGNIKGYMVLLDNGENCLLIDNLAVDDSCQKRGYGRALMNFAEEEARRRKAKYIELYTNEAMHENLAWYARMGYIETDRRKDKGYSRVFFRKNV